MYLKRNNQNYFLYRYKPVEICNNVKRHVVTVSNSKIKTEANWLKYVLIVLKKVIN